MATEPPENDDEPRYTVIKGAPPKMTFPNRDREILEPGTYFVLRDTDALAGPLLWMYLHEIETYLDVARQKPGFISAEGIAEMEQRAKAVEQTAVEWQRRGVGRLPA
jgi:hypothetical protein